MRTRDRCLRLTYDITSKVKRGVMSRKNFVRQKNISLHNIKNFRRIRTLVNDGLIESPSSIGHSFERQDVNDVFFIMDLCHCYGFADKNSTSHS